MVRVVLGVAKAAVESKAWLFATQASYYSHDHAGVIMQPAIHNFMQGDPSGSKDLVFLGCKSLGCSRRKEDVLPFKQGELGFGWHSPRAIDLMNYAVEVGTPVVNRLVYPDVNRLIWPEPPHVQGIAFNALPHFLTHLILFQDWNNQRPDMRFEALLTRAIPHANVAIGGTAWNDESPRIIDYCIELTARGNHVVLMENTGVPARVLSI